MTCDRAIPVSAVALLLLASIPVQAADERPTRWDKPFHGILLTGITEGGDKLAYVDVENGFGNTERTNLKAGGQFLVGLGVGYRPPGSAFSVQASISWHSDSVSAGLDRAAFDRFPVDLLGYYSIGSHRLGLGATLALNPRLDMKDANGDVVDFDAAAGVLLQYDYRWRNLGFGVRYVDIDYEVDTINGTSPTQAAPIDGNHVGLMLTIPF